MPVSRPEPDEHRAPQSRLPFTISGELRQRRFVGASLPPRRQPRVAIGGVLIEQSRDPRRQRVAHLRICRRHVGTKTWMGGHETAVRKHREHMPGQALGPKWGLATDVGHHPPDEPPQPTGEIVKREVGTDAIAVRERRRATNRSISAGRRFEKCRCSMVQHTGRAGGAPGPSPYPVYRPKQGGSADREDQIMTIKSDRCGGPGPQRDRRRRRKALAITESELSDIAAAATIGLNTQPR